MPELPEVQNVVDTLNLSVKGLIIRKVDLIYSKLVELNSLPLESLENKEILRVDRRGKYLIFRFEDLNMISHLRMEGRYYLSNTPTPLSKHAHCLFHFTNGMTLQYIDTRKFGRLCVTKDVENYFLQRKIGLEPFDSTLDKHYLHHRFQKHHKNIKTCLLDQSIVAGIGNIYADEILFKTKIHPEREANRISLHKCQDLVVAIQETLQSAIEQGGTTIRSFESSQHVSGLFQVNLLAYGRKGLPCVRCQTEMKRIVVSGRGTTYCPKCQRKRV